MMVAPVLHQRQHIAAEAAFIGRRMPTLKNAVIHTAAEMPDESTE
jgi:hypothetical protein